MTTSEKKDLKIKRSQPGMWMQDLREDIHNEGDRWPITVDLPHLDADQALQYVKDLQRNTPRYQLARNNCSHLVAAALMAGPPASQRSRLTRATTVRSGGCWESASGRPTRY